MKLLLIALAVATMSTSAVAADVGVSVSIGQPGYYGRLDIGNAYPQPQVIYSQPRIVISAPQVHEPVYMRVPPGHRKNWKKHCREYNACGERVYFVQDNWYQSDYAPRYQQQHGGGKDGHDGNYQQGGNEHRDGGGNDHKDNHGGGNKGNDHGNGHR